MGEQSFLKVLQSDPENEEVRAAYLRWLETTDDPRMPFIELMKQRLRLLELLKETDRRLLLDQGVESEWIDLVFPMRVRSPLAGRCYLKPLPESRPFIEVGSHVTPETVVCLVETLGLFQEITAGWKGIVSAIKVANGESVEYNQILFRVARLSLDFW